MRIVASSTRPIVRGFTLMEVLIALVIVAALAALAIPNYTEYVNRGYRSDARAALLLAAQWQERFRTENNAYSSTLPASFAAVPASGTARYTVAVSQPGGSQTFLLTATRTGPQASDSCGDFTLDHLGTRGTVGASRPVDECWAR
jgi:type IV pilus assembly protein PilE